MTSLHTRWFHIARGAGIGRIFGLISNLLLSRFLVASDLGLFNLVTTTVQTSDTLLRCGSDYSLNYELGGERDATRTERGRQFIRAVSQLCGITTFLTCILVFIWVWLGKGLFPSSIPTPQRSALILLLLIMIACEGASSAAWEALLASHRTSLFAFRQGLFFPLRLLSAAIGGFFGGVIGAMCGWSLIGVIQCFWLKSALGDLWQPLHIWPLLSKRLHQLLRRGLPFYASNLLSSIIFYPLLLKVAYASGLSDIGYLRVGQILQQLFAFLPATLVPVLFLRLRSEPSFLKSVLFIEKPLRLIWLLLLESLLVYCVFDHSIIVWLFGSSYISALIPTRLLLITSLFECLAQLLVQPLLASGQTRVFAVWQNGAALISASLGWLWVPSAGLSAYLIVRMIYTIIPLLRYLYPFLLQSRYPSKTLQLAITTIITLFALLAQAVADSVFDYMPAFFMALFIALAFCRREDLLFLRSAIIKKT